MTSSPTLSNLSSPDGGPPGLWSFWIDRGGTFTDVVGQAPDGELHTLKLPSLSREYRDAAVEAMRRLTNTPPGEPFPAARVAAIKIGTTVATNALLERTGAKTLFVTTAGFADALEIGDQTRPDLFALTIAKPPPLYAGVIEADERIGADGAVVRPLDETALSARLAQAVVAGYESVAVCFLHSDLNPAHERRAARIAREIGDWTVVTGADVSPLPRFIPRAQTAVIDAYLTPVVRRYVEEVAGAVAGAPLFFMTSGGGLARPAAFCGRDAVLSGPAGGAVGVARTAQRAGGGRPILGFDMGGTSTDVCRFAGVLERKAGATVAGVSIRRPMLDIQTVAAGGGSVLGFDGLRARVGPASAGADPGPAAYGRGGPATVTDANLVLGRIDPTAFPAVFGADGASPLDVAAAQARLAELAEAMGATDVGAAAEGFLAIAVEQMAGAIGKLSTARGFDPRDHALLAFGGAGGQVACLVAEALGMDEILCPRYASVLSAWGMGQARMRVLRQAGVEQTLDDAGLAAAGAAADRLADDVRAALREQDAQIGTVQRRLRLRYAESDTDMAVDFGAPAAVRTAFETAHQRLFGFVEDGGRVMIAAVEVEGEEEESSPERGGPRPQVAQSVIVSDTDGPRLILRADTQIWVAPGWRANSDDDGLIRLTRLGASAASDRNDSAVDPVTLELYNRRFMGVAEAMGAALERTARSVNIKERLDFSCALFDAAGGLVANAPHMPVHLGSMGASVRAVLARHPVQRSGDAFALNNPYAGGTHLPDITVVMPVFGDADGNGAPAFFVAARGHHADVGGIQPGSMPPFSTSIDQEGVMLDAVPIMRGGRFLEAETRATLGAGAFPARSPSRNIGDLKAQIAACQAGAAAVLAMIAARGSEEVGAYMRHVQANAEACVRRAVQSLKPGSARVAMDGGGEIAIEISVDPAAGAATLDFRASSDQSASNFNAPSSVVDAAALYVFRTLVDDDIPLNSGCLTPLKVVVRTGSLLDPGYPAAVVAGNVETSQHVVDALYDALGVMAHSQGSMNNFTFGNDEAQYYETLCGGVGATARAPGASAVHSHMTNSRLTDPEILERRFPVRVEAFAVRRGSGGTGAHPGGDGAVRRIRFLAPLQAALLSSRRVHAPRGLSGGGDGVVGSQRLIATDGTVKELPGCFAVDVRPGEIIEIHTPGGGGFGAAPAG